MLREKARHVLSQCPKKRRRLLTWVTRTATGQSKAKKKLGWIMKSIDKRDQATKEVSFPNLANENSETIPKQISARFAGEYALTLLAVNAQSMNAFLFVIFLIFP